MIPPDDQPGFDFSSRSDGPDGYSRWQAERRAALASLARALGLPLGHRVDAELRGGVRLEGILQLADDELWLEPRRDLRIRLRIGRCTFAAEEIERCVRTD